MKRQCQTRQSLEKEKHKKKDGIIGSEKNLHSKGKEGER